MRTTTERLLVLVIDSSLQLALNLAGVARASALSDASTL